MAGRYTGPWKNAVAIDDLREVFEMGLQYLSNRDTPEGYNVVALTSKKAVIFIGTASETKNAEIAELIEHWIDS